MSERDIDGGIDYVDDIDYSDIPPLDDTFWSAATFSQGSIPTQLLNMTNTGGVMIPSMNEIEKAKVEYLKKFPELVLEIKRYRMACCHRCGGFIDLSHYCLVSMTHSYTDFDKFKKFGCPHCGKLNITKREYRPESVRREPIDHSLVEVIEYCVERKKVKKGLFKTEIVETWIKEWYPV